MIHLVHFTTVFKCRMPNMSFVVVVSCSSMYEAYCLLLRGKNLNILAILRKKLCLKYQNLPIFAEKRFIESKVKAISDTGREEAQEVKTISIHFFYVKKSYRRAT